MNMSFGKMDGDATPEQWKAVIEHAKTHEKVDQAYPGWKEKLGYTGESSATSGSIALGRARSGPFAGSLGLRAMLRYGFPASPLVLLGCTEDLSSLFRRSSSVSSLRFPSFW